MLSFATLFIELLKIQDYLKDRQITIDTKWSATDNCNQDLINFTVRRDFKLFQWTIIRHSWDNWAEFMLTDCNGNHYYRIDPLTKLPVRIDKTNPMFNIWTTINSPIAETQEFAREIYTILNDLEQKVLRANSDYYHALAKKMC